MTGCHSGREDFRRQNGQRRKRNIAMSNFLAVHGCANVHVIRRFLQPLRRCAFNFEVIQSFKGKAIHLARRSGFLHPLSREHSILYSPVADLRVIRPGVRRFAPNQVFT
jgi:hypothetical protein